MAIIAIAASFASAFAQDLQILVNNVGYEKSGAKRAVVQSSSAIAAAEADIIPAAGGNAVRTVPLGALVAVSGWSGRNFKVADFSSFDTDGEYKIRVGSVTSPAFSIGEKVLQAKTGADQLAFFKAYRSTDAGDKNLPIFGSDRKVNIYGGWIDASGDEGKHISHLSYANYYNPQQIPLVAWALLHAREAQPEAFGAEALAEAAWGADFLLRALSPEGYFYMSVFDNWGGGYTFDAPKLPDSKGSREVCAWSHTEGVRS
ncbi:MAG: glycoside hydrolase family 9 protein, partial [Chitinispirillales bacterium]|nr:glycoside hydrolase family 9 protein [Chitinispirillales bacterium]